MDAARVLGQVSLFAALSDAEIAPIAAKAQRRHCPAGTQILQQDEPGNAAFFILNGAVDVVLEAEDGRQFIVARLGEGDHFGEMALLDAERRSASVVATEETDVLVLRREDFLREMESNPKLMRTMLTVLCQRLRSADAQLAALAFGDTSVRLARLLLERAVSTERGLTVSEVQEDLADMVGATRQTVGRIFSAWRRLGYIRTGRRSTTVLRPDALLQIARL